MCPVGSPSFQDRLLWGMSHSNMCFGASPSSGYPAASTCTTQQTLAIVSDKVCFCASFGTWQALSTSSAQKLSLAQGGFADEWTVTLSPVLNNPSLHLICFWCSSKSVWRNTLMLAKGLSREVILMINQWRATVHIDNRQHPTAWYRPKNNALYSPSQSSEELQCCIFPILPYLYLHPSFWHLNSILQIANDIHLKLGKRI